MLQKYLLRKRRNGPRARKSLGRSSASAFFLKRKKGSRGGKGKERKGKKKELNQEIIPLKSDNSKETEAEGSCSRQKRVARGGGDRWIDSKSIWGAGLRIGQ